MKKKYIICLSLAALLTGCTEPIKTIPQDSFAEMSALDALLETVSTEKNVCTVPPEEIVLKNLDTVEVYDKITVNEFVYESNVELINGNEFIDTGKTGNLETVAKYNYEGVLYEQKLSYTVKDTTPPLLLSSGNGASVETGTAFDLNDYVGFGDNYDREPVLTYEGTVDTSAAGSYPLTATVRDSSGNETSWELTINVKDNIPSPEDNEERFQFEDFIREYGGDGKRLGIDVSRWQGDIDFNAVKDAGCEFVIIRIGSYFDEYTLDSCYKANIAAAKAAGLDVGVYIYTTTDSPESAKENAEWIIKQLDGIKLELPVVFDWECFYEFQKYRMNIHDLNEFFRIFAKEVEKNGCKAMLYSSKNFLNNFWEEQTEYPVWLAHYTDKTDYTGKYTLWQMSSRGNIPGIDGDVDFNIFYK